MGSIEIYDRFWTDPRYLSLLALIGPQSSVYAVVSAWRLSATLPKFKGTVPAVAFKGLAYWQELVKCELAVEKPEGFYIKGSRAVLLKSSRFKRAGTKGGKISAKRPRDKNGRLMPKVSSTPAEIVSTSHQAITKPHQAFVKKHQATTKPRLDDAATKEGLEIRSCVAIYAACFKARYKCNPTITKRDTGALRRMLKSLGVNKLKTLLQVYVQMNDPWFEKKFHDIHTFEGNLSKIGVSTVTGIDPDRKADPFSFLEQDKGVF